jgi:hypothetical protein
METQGGIEIYLHAFLTCALDRPLYPSGNAVSGSRRMGDRVGPKAGLDAVM